MWCYFTPYRETRFQSKWCSLGDIFCWNRPVLILPSSRTGFGNGTVKLIPFPLPHPGICRLSWACWLFDSHWAILVVKQFLSGIITEAKKRPRLGTYNPCSEAEAFGLPPWRRHWLVSTVRVASKADEGKEGSISTSSLTVKITVIHGKIVLSFSSFIECVTYRDYNCNIQIAKVERRRLWRWNMVGLLGNNTIYLHWLLSFL